MITIGMLVFITKLPTHESAPLKLTRPGGGVGGFIVDSVDECGEGVTL